MSFPFINKTLRLNNLKARTAINVKISLFVIYVETIIYLLLYNLLLYNLHDCTFKWINITDLTLFFSSFANSLILWNQSGLAALQNPVFFPSIKPPSVIAFWLLFVRNHWNIVLLTSSYPPVPFFKVCTWLFQNS